jgi:hypothetical protein
VQDNGKSGGGIRMVFYFLNQIKAIKGKRELAIATLRK